MSPEHVTYREVREVLDRIEGKIDARLGGLEDDFQAHALDDERRFGRVEKLLVGGGVVQTVVWGAVALAKGVGPAHAVAQLAQHLS